MAKGGYYAVRNGRSNGVYNDWSNCEQQVKGHSGAEFKRFDTLQEANNFMGAGSSGGSSSARDTSGSSTRSPYTSEGGSNRSSYSPGFGGGYGGSNTSSSTYKQSSSSYTPSYAPSKQDSYDSGSYSKTSKGYSSRASTARNDGSSSQPSGGVKYYAVKSSNASIPDKIFKNWKECQAYTKGNRGLSFKKFDSLESSRDFINNKTDAADYRFIGSDASTFARAHRASTSKPVKKEEIYCDGSSLNNGFSNARAGIGIHFKNGTSRDIAAPLGAGLQTNNRAELQAARTALDTAYSSLKSGENIDYTLHTDSEYVAKLLNDRYSTYSSEHLNAMPNSDIIKPLVKSYAQVKQYYLSNSETYGSKDFKVEWVKAHNGQQENETADALAKKGALMD